MYFFVCAATPMWFEMKRRVEEAAKQEGSSSSVTGGLSGRASGPPGGPAIVYSGPVRQHHNRGITPPGKL